MFRFNIDQKGMQTVRISLVTVLVALTIISGIAWANRASIFRLLAEEYVKEVEKSLSAETGNKPESEAPVLSQESFVVNAVRKANPAVVSIIITKDVPKYEAFYRENNPFKDFFGDDFFFPNFFFSVPEYKQNGTEKKQVGGGSGFFVSSNGLIVTNRHVVDQKDAEYTVFTNDGEKHPAKVVALDPILDIAVIKIDGSNYPSLEFGDSDKLEPGQTVIAIGNALGEFRNTVSVGVISGLSRSIVAGDGAGRSEALDQVIQTDAAINPGNSGGPLLNLSGKVVGVNVAVASGSQNVGFALPVNSLKGAVESVKATGKIVRPYVGIRYLTITPAIKEKNKLSVDYGILVQRGKEDGELAVIPGSPADKAGIVENDIILEVDGKELDDDNNFALIIRQHKVGDKVKLKILHKGTEKTIEVTLEAAPNS